LKKRLPSEWEKQEATIVVFPTFSHLDWYHSLSEIQQSYVKFINAIKEFQKCYVVCDDFDSFKKHFIDFKDIEIINIKTNDTWIRDFGAINVFEDSKLKYYNFKFNAWGDKFSSNLDNDFNKKFHKKNLVDIDFILEGGSIDSNGKGTLLTTSKCIYNVNRNSHLTKDEIEKKLINFFDLKKLIVLNHGSLAGDDTDSHIDTLARFIDENTIAYIKCYDKNDEHFEELKKMEDELKKTGFNLVALPIPKAHYFNDHRLPATYINFLFLNDALILPTYQDEKNDNLAFEILSNHISNKKIIKVDATVFIREHGSLHCASSNMIQN